MVRPEVDMADVVLAAFVRAVESVEYHVAQGPADLDAAAAMVRVSQMLIAHPYAPRDDVRWAKALRRLRVAEPAVAGYLGVDGRGGVVVSVVSHAGREPAQR
jgi:hypothetical protein